MKDYSKKPIRIHDQLEKIMVEMKADNMVFVFEDEIDGGLVEEPIEAELQAIENQIYAYVNKFEELRMEKAK